MRRLLIGMTQEKLGEALGVTFQQVQKYEKGTNRIGASRLQRIAQVLNVAPAFFFDDMPGQPSTPVAGFAEGDSAAVVSFLSTPEGMQLSKAFVRIKDPKVRRKLIDLITAVADAGAATQDEDALPSQD